MSVTTEDLGRLRVPLAALPGLDPVGLRVVAMWGPRVDVRAPCVTTDGRNVLVWEDGADCLTVIGTEYASVDLADAATRDRVARWLAGRVGLEVGSTAPGWRYTPNGGGGWWIDAGHAPIFRRTAPGRDDLDPYVPALADLDPTDDRRLPDGCRYVDALALALVAVGAP